MAKARLDDTGLSNLVNAFHEQVRRAAFLGRIFAARIADWEPHLHRMVAFRSSVALMTRRYRGRPVPVHTPLPFILKLALFQQTAQEGRLPVRHT